MPSVVVIGLFCTYFTPIQVVTVVEGQTDCYDTLYCPTRSNVLHSNFLASAVKYENEANAAEKLDTRSEFRKGAFDHHDTLET